jgi:hypothetical protein
LYIDYLDAKSTATTVLGTTTEFMESLSSTAFVGGYIINTDLTLNGNLYVSCNISLDSTLTLNDTLIVTNGCTFQSSVNINSDLVVEGTTVIEDDLYVSNSVQATEYVSVSDERIKTNVHTVSFENAKSIIENLRIKEYQFKTETGTGTGGGTRIGLVAQDLLQLPQLNNFVKHTKKEYTIQVEKEIIWDQEKNCYYLLDHKFNLEDTLVDNSGNCYRVTEILNKDEFMTATASVQGTYSIFIKEQRVQNLLNINYPEILNMSLVCIQELLVYTDKIMKKFGIDP